MTTLLRFEKESGPASLFERAQFMFNKQHIRTLKLTARTKVQCSFALQNALEAFEVRAWDLVAVYAKQDSGKFTKTVWQKTVDGVVWLVTIGYQDNVHSVTTPTSAGEAIRAQTEEVVRHQGQRYMHVDQVNTELMREEAALQVNAASQPHPRPLYTATTCISAQKGFGDDPPAFFHTPRRAAPAPNDLNDELC
ncbi:MAG: hypothetical protein WCI89_03670 [bacterium]